MRIARKMCLQALRNRNEGALDRLRVATEDVLDAAEALLPEGFSAYLDVTNSDLTLKVFWRAEINPDIDYVAVEPFFDSICAAVPEWWDATDDHESNAEIISISRTLKAKRTLG